MGFPWILTTCATVVWNQDASSVLTRNFLLNFENSKYFKIIDYTDNYRDIQHMIDSGEVMMALIIPKDFSHYIESGKTAPFTVDRGWKRCQYRDYRHGLCACGSFSIQCTIC